MDILLLAALILLNAVFAMSEIALVSSRKGRLRRLAEDGKPGALSALHLREDPSSFLSTVQVGITTIGIMSGAIGENALAEPLIGLLEQLPLVAPYAHLIALTVVVSGLTYFSVVIGELVPKRLALLAPELIVSIVAAPMMGLSRVAKPIVWLLSSSSTLLLRMIGAPQKETESVTNDEIRVLMEEGSHSGVFHESEQAIVSNVLRLDEQKASTIMTLRQDIYFVDLNDSAAEIRRRLSESPYTRIVLCHGGLDHVIGILRTTDLLKSALANEALRLRQAGYPPLYIPRGVTLTTLLEHFRRSGQLMALIVDEYGVIEGLVTLTDVMTAIVGDLPSDQDVEEDMVQRQDGSWLVSGSVTIAEFRETLELEDPLPGESEHFFQTLGGFMMYKLGRIPAVADRVQVADCLFEVMDMDQNRVDKVLVSKLD
jgi:putative hemolysin